MERVFKRKVQNGKYKTKTQNSKVLSFKLSFCALRSPFSALLVGASFLVTSSVCRAEEIPHVSSEMEKPSYWIARLSEPDRVLLTSSQIEVLNQKFLRAEPTAIDPLTFPEHVNPSMLLAPLEKEEGVLLEKTLYDRKGRGVGKEFIAGLKALCALHAIPDLIPVRFGLVVQECSLRTYPTTEPLVEEKGKFAFDLLQQTTLHPGEPVAVLWESRDREWIYLVTSLLRGWVKKGSVATFRNKEELVEYQREPYLVMTERTTPFYENPGGDVVGEWKMGTIFHASPIQKESEYSEYYGFARPIRDQNGGIAFSIVYVRKEGVNLGFLPLTARNILTQAFKLYGAPYGWGGLNGGWDCSSFLRDIFLTMGVELPRNSGPQSRLGKIYKHSFKKPHFDASLPAQTFVKLKGHIMLYLGKVDGRHYVIHATAGYRRPGNFAKKIILKDKVVTTYRALVSDMDLGKGGKTGSLLERMLSTNLPFADGSS